MPARLPHLAAEPGRPTAPRLSAVRVPAAQPGRELETLLRTRLIVVVWVSLGFFGLLPLLSVPQLLVPGVPRAVRAFMTMQWVVAGIALGLGIILWRRPRLPVKTLRIIELVLFGGAVAVVGIGGAYIAHRYGWLTLPEGRVGHPVLTSAGTRLDPVTLRWIILVVGYGTLIPNTWRRCAVVVGTTAATALGVLLVQAVLAGLRGGSLFGVMLYPTVWLTTASVVSIFGSYRLNVLREEVDEARKLGQYRLKRKLGYGGMGEVYLAEHVLLKQPCAVKLIRPERAADGEILGRFEREVQATARLKHPNTVEIYDYGRAPDGTFYYVMEYLPGLNLEQLVERHGPLPPARAVHVLRQVCGALHEAHGIGLVHRDLKPANVILCERGGVPDVAKLLDFGLVKLLEPESSDPALTVPGVAAGTPAFMSPEQAGGLPLDARSDIYSLGAVAHYLLTGHPPFTHRGSVAVMAAHIYEVPASLAEQWPELPPALADVVSRCLSKDPAARFPSASVLERALATSDGVPPWDSDEAARWWASRGEPTWADVAVREGRT